MTSADIFVDSAGEYSSKYCVHTTLVHYLPVVKPGRGMNTVDYSEVEPIGALVLPDSRQTESDAKSRPIAK
jgi:hypothetical protein